MIVEVEDLTARDRQLLRELQALSDADAPRVGAVEALRTIEPPDLSHLAGILAGVEQNGAPVQ